MANETVYFDSAETGAPVLNNAAGSLDAVLNACLVTGFNVQTVTSVVVASGVATVTKTGHGFANGRMVDMAGATPSGLNGRKLITVTGSGTYTYPAPGVADGTATGTITAKRSPLGWARPLSSGNVSIYARTDVEAPPNVLRVDDSGTGAASATAARWRMLETYTDLSTFTGPTPPDGVYGNAGHFIPKGVNSTAAKAWVLVGDSRTFYLFTEASSYPAATVGGTPQGIWGFGEFISHKSGDAYRDFIAGAEAAATSSTRAMGLVRGLDTTLTDYQMALCRDYRGLDPAVPASVNGIAGNGSVDRRLGGPGGGTFPDVVGNGLVIQTPVFFSEKGATRHPLRGRMRGLGDPLSAIPAGMMHLQVVTMIDSGKRWLLVGYNQNGTAGHAAFNLSDPWG